MIEKIGIIKRSDTDSLKNLVIGKKAANADGITGVLPAGCLPLFVLSCYVCPQPDLMEDPWVCLFKKNH